MCTATVGCLRLTMINYGQCFSFSFIAWFLTPSVYGVFFKYRNRYDYKNNLNYTNSKNEFQIIAMCYIILMIVAGEWNKMNICSEPRHNHGFDHGEDYEGTVLYFSV